MKPFHLLVLLLFAPWRAPAQEKDEGALVAKIAQTLVTGDAAGYTQLFPSAGLIAQTIIAHAPEGSPDWNLMQGWQSNPTLMETYNNRLDTLLQRSFNEVRELGTAQGIRWSSVRLSRYELVKAGRTRDSLYEKLAPERFIGYVFLYDPYLQKTFCFTVGDVLKIGDGWWGGTLTHIYPADTKEAFEKHLEAARKAALKGETYLPEGTPAADRDEDGDRPEQAPNLPAAAGGSRKVVVDRHLYRGTFDNEIAVQLYVRGLRGTCPEGVCSWEAAFKFGDQDEWSLMGVSRSGGKWIFSETTGDGVLELELKNGTYTGTWTDSADKTGYEAVLKDEPPTPKKQKALDGVLDGE